MKVATFILIGLSTGTASIASAGEIRFMEGAKCTQNHKGETSDAPGQDINFKKEKYKKKGFDNDDAKSLALFNVRAGTRVRVYDDPDGKTKDDWTDIIVKRYVQELCVNSFERVYENADVKVTWHENNGLDGKVSHVKVD